MGIDCKCGGANCDSTTGFYCVAASNSCSPRPPLSCSASDAKVINSHGIDCQCGAADCTDKRYCSADTSTCTDRPPIACSVVNGTTANAAGTDCTCGATPWTKIFDGECSTGSEIQMYEGNGDNTGVTDAARDQQCGEACRSRKPSLTGTWTNFRALGFVVNPTNGRCYCEDDFSSSCTRVLNTYDRYDFSDCTSSTGMYCISSSNSCAFRPLIKCAKDDGSTINKFGIDCNCGAAICTKESGMYCASERSMCYQRPLPRPPEFLTPRVTSKNKATVTIGVPKKGGETAQITHARLLISSRYPRQEEPSSCARILFGECKNLNVYYRQWCHSACGYNGALQVNTHGPPTTQYADTGAFLACGDNSQPGTTKRTLKTASPAKRIVFWSYQTEQSCGSRVCHSQAGSKYHSGCYSGNGWSYVGSDFTDYWSYTDKKWTSDSVRAHIAAEKSFESSLLFNITITAVEDLEKDLIGSEHEVVLPNIENVCFSSFCIWEISFCNADGCSVELTNATTSVPDSPDSVDIRVASKGNLNIKIVAPMNDGGSNVTHYLMTYAPGSPTSMVDVSTGQPARSSGLHSTGATATKAVDGDFGRTYPNEFHGKCTTSSDFLINAWWGVELNQPGYVFDVTF